MALPKQYTVGTVSVTNGSTAVTGAGGTIWTGNIAPDDILWVNGLSCRVLTVNSNTSITLARPWPGATVSGAAYEIRYTLDAIGLQVRLRALVDLLSGGNTAAFAGLASANNLLPWFNGSGTMATTSLTPFARTILDDADAASVRGTIAANNAENLTTGIANVARIPHFQGNQGGDGWCRLTNSWTGDWTVGGALCISGTGQVYGAYDAATVWRFSPGGVMDIGTVPAGRIGNTGNLIIGPQAEYISPFGGTLLAGMTYLNGSSLRVSRASVPVELQRTATNGSIITFYREATQVGAINVTDTSTAYITTSDHRLKTDVLPLVEFSLSPDQFETLDDSLLRVLCWRPVSYTWINDPDAGLTHGFLAHELQAVSPHAVTGDKDAMEDIGTAVTPERVIREENIIEVRDPETSEVVETITEPREIEPEQVFEGIPQADAPEGSTWTATGSRPVYQGVDHSKLVPDLAAALQSLTLLVLDQQDTIAALNVRLETLEAAAL